MELRCDRVHQILTRAVCTQVDNLGIIGGDAAVLLPALFPPSCVSLICEAGRQAGRQC